LERETGAADVAAGAGAEPPFVFLLQVVPHHTMSRGHRRNGAETVGRRDPVNREACNANDESAGTKASDDKDDQVKRNEATRGTYSQPHEAVCWLARLHGGSFSGR
jgi:hypothetical protein